MRILHLALKDLSQVLRDLKSLIFLLAMPLVFTFIMGLAYTPAEAVQEESLPILGWLNHDTSGVLAARFEALLTANSALRLESGAPLALDAAARAVQTGRWAGALVVPPNFSQHLAAGEDIPLTFIAAPSAPQSLALHAAVEAALASLTIAPAEFAGADATMPLFSIVTEKVAADRSATMTNPYQQSSPGMIVQFAVFGLTTSASLLVVEHKLRTLHRMVAASLSGIQIILGHLLAMFSLALAQLILLIAAGQWLFRVDYLREAFAALLVAAALAFWVSCLGLLIGVVAKSEEQAVLGALIAMFLFTSLGGAWFPLEGTGAAFSKLGHLTPAAWAMDAFQNLIIRGLGLESVLKPVAVLTVYALVFLSAALILFRRRQVV